MYRGSKYQSRGTYEQWKNTEHEPLCRPVSAPETRTISRRRIPSFSAFAVIAATIALFEGGSHVNLKDGVQCKVESLSQFTCTAKGVVVDRIVYDSRLTTEQIQKIEDYLQKKYGL